MRKTTWIAALAAGLLGAGTTLAAPVFTTDMGSSAVTNVTAATLDSVSSGGSWDVVFINITSANIVGTTNLTDFALVVDEGGLAGSSTGTYVTVTLDSDVDYATTPVLVQFDMAAARGGGGKFLTVTGYGEDDATVVFQVVMNCSSYLYQGLTGSGLQTVVDGPQNFLVGTAPYDPSLVGQFSLMLDGTSLIYSTPAAGSLNTANLNAQTKLRSIKWEISGGTDAAQGFWLDNISVEPTDGNRAPLAGDITETVDEDDSVEITLIGSDPDDDDLTYNVSQPLNGTVTTNGVLPNIIYTPDANYEGSDSFTYTVNDGEYDSAVATVSITVNPGYDDAPVADDIEATVIENGSVEITLSGLDPEDGTNLTYAVVSGSGPSHGSLSDTTGQVLTYTPNADYFGDDEFTYTVNDGAQDSAPATVSITVTEKVDYLSVIYVDFGTTAGETTAPEIYNSLAPTSTGANPSSLEGTGQDFTGLVDINGDVSGVDLHFLVASDAGDVRAFQKSDAHDAVSGLDANATGDGFWMNCGTVPGTLTFTLTYTNLNNTPYDLYLVPGPTSQDVTWDVTTGTGDDDTFTFTTATAPTDTAAWSSVTPVGGTIVLTGTMTAVGTYNSTRVNFMSLSEVPATGVGDISIEVVSGGTEVTLTWATELGGNYGVLAIENLAFDSWDAATIITDGVPGTGGDVTITNAVSEDAEFYRAYLED